MFSVLLNFDQDSPGLKEAEEMSFGHSDQSQAALTAVRWRCEGMPLLCWQEHRLEQTGTLWAAQAGGEQPLGGTHQEPAFGCCWALCLRACA